MFIGERVEVALQILDVLNRADCAYVPLRIFSRVYQTKKSTLNDTLHILKKAGIVGTQRGRTGGYTFNRACTLFELMKLFCPTNLPRVQARSCNYRVDTLKKKVVLLTQNLTFVPRERAGREQAE
jgi:hypothetical protein